jgi:hypothetical protein
MPEWAKILLLIFSVYRTASLLSSEEGPYLPFLYKDPDQRGVFEWLRKKLGADNFVYTYDEDGHQEVKIATNLGRGITCPLCTGGYVSFLVVIFYFSDNIIISFFILWLGIWGVQTFLENLTSDDALKGAIEDVADNMEDK